MQENNETVYGEILIRFATINDIEQITEIYNQGIEDRIATMEAHTKSIDEEAHWFSSRSERHKVLVVEDEKGGIKGWASLNVFNARECYGGVADLSIYIRRTERGKGFGKQLLIALIEIAKEVGFHKLVLTTFASNLAGQRLYASLGFTKVGTYTKQGVLDGQWMDTTIMEKLIVDL